jgi:hypothetical protein
MCEESVQTKFFEACFQGHKDAVIAMLAEAVDLDWHHPRHGWTALHAAVENDHLDIVRELVAAGANLEALDTSGWTPLCLAVDAEIDGSHQTGKPLSLEITTLLLEAGANPVGDAKTSPLGIAQDYECDEAVRLLKQFVV